MYRTYVIVLVLVLIFLLVFNAASGESFYDHPEWVEGKLFISMLGSNTGNIDYIQADRYVVIFDFDNDCITTLKVPRESYLTNSIGESDGPMIFFNADNNYDWENGLSGSKWRQFWTARFDPNTCSFLLGSSDDGLYEKEGVIYFSRYASPLCLDAPLKLLCCRVPEYGVYYLCYGIQGDQLNVQLVYETNQKREVISSFPISQNFGRWDYSISLGGNVAWYYKGIINARIESHDYHTATGNESFSAICWLNDYQLAFFQPSSEGMILSVASLSENFEDMRIEIPSNINCNIGFETAFEIAMSHNNDQLAIFHIPYREQDDHYYVTIYSIARNKSFTFDPWPLFNNGNDLTNTNSVNLFGISDDGILYWQPSEGSADIQLAWY